MVPNHPKHLIYYRSHSLWINLPSEYKLTNSLNNFKIKTSKFEWMLRDIRIEKIISAPIWATKIFFGSSIKEN